MRDFAGKRYWLIGADTPLGAALADRLSRAGTELVLSGADQGALEDLTVSLSGRSDYIPLDITRPQSHDPVAIELGPLDGMVYAMDARCPSPLQDWSGTAVAACLDANLVGIAHALDIALPLMRGRDDAHVVLCDSLAAVTGQAGQGAYAASKAGVRLLAEALHADPAPGAPAVQLVTLGLPDGVLRVSPEAAAAGIVEHMGTTRFRRTLPAAAGGVLRALHILPQWMTRPVLALLVGRAQD